MYAIQRSIDVLSHKELFMQCARAHGKKCAKFCQYLQKIWHTHTHTPQFNGFPSPSHSRHYSLPLGSLISKQPQKNSICILLVNRHFEKSLQMLSLEDHQCALIWAFHCITVPAIEIEHRKFTRSISPSSRSSFKLFLIIGRCMLMMYQKFLENPPCCTETSVILVKYVRALFPRPLFTALSE